MRTLALLVGAALLLAAPVDAGAKRPRFAAKRGSAAKKRATTGWRATPRVVTVVAAPRPVDAPVTPAGDVVAEQPAPSPAPSPTPLPPAVPPCDPSPWLGVTAEDVGGFRFRLSRTCVPAGTVLFQFRNLDLADHNLWAEGVEPVAAPRRVVADTPGETTVTGSAPLAAGRWRLYCSFDGHEAMSRLVDVTPAG